MSVALSTNGCGGLVTPLSKLHRDDTRAPPEPCDENNDSLDSSAITGLATEKT